MPSQPGAARKPDALSYAAAVLVRAATDADADLLWLALHDAFNWTGERRLTLAELRERPDVAHYVEGWRRPGDFGVVAVADDGKAAGAAWGRVLPTADPGYGFVAADVPELSMAVFGDYRGRGIGSALLAAVVDQARGLDLGRLSLSVEDANPARRLYERAGFVLAGRNGGSDTLVLELG